MEAIDEIAAAFKQKDEEIAEMEAKIKKVTEDLSFNVGLIQQRDNEILKLQETIKEMKRTNETAKSHEEKVEAKAARINQRCEEIERRIEAHLKEQEDAEQILIRTRDEYETNKAIMLQRKQRIQEEALRKEREMEEEKERLLRGIQGDEQKILELQHIAREMRDTVSTMLNDLYATHAEEMEKINGQIAELESGNEELIEALHDAQYRARAEVGEKQKELQQMMYQRAQMDEERASESKARIRQMECDLEEKKNRKKALQKELEMLKQAQRTRDEVIGHLRARYENEESQIQAQAQDLRIERRSQKKQIDKLKEELIEAKRTEQEYMRRLEELRKARVQDQKEWNEKEREIEEYKARLDAEYAALRSKTENAVAKLKDAENVLEDLNQKQTELKQRVKSSAEELQRQHNEAMRAKQILEERRDLLNDLKGQLAKLRVEKRTKATQPKISTVELKPLPLHSDPLNFPSDLEIASPPPEMFVLSPIDSENSGFAGDNQVIADLKVKLEEAERTAQEFAQHIANKKAELQQKKGEGSKLDLLRQENARLKQKKREMDAMKDEIVNYRQLRSAI